jgi:hypothetical protein
MVGTGGTHRRNMGHGGNGNNLARTQ